MTRQTIATAKKRRGIKRQPRRAAAITLRARRGQTLLIASVLLFFLLTLSLAVSETNRAVFRASNNLAKSRVANAAASSAVQKSIWCLNNSAASTDCGGTAGGNFTGESNVALTDAVYTSSVSTIDYLTKQIDVTAYSPNATAPVAVQRLRVRATIKTDELAFNYALQAGEGGLEMENNSSVTGNVYSNGNISGDNGAAISGDVWVAGGTQPTPNQQSTAQNGDLPFGQDSNVVDPSQSFRPNVGGPLNSVSLYLKKVGTPSNKTVYIVRDDGGQPKKDSIASATLDTSLITGAYGWINVAFTSPPTVTSGTPYWIVIDSSTNGSNYLVWGKDTAQGYSGGTGKTSPDWNAGHPDWFDANADLAFKVWMGGVATFLDKVSVGGSLHANTIKNCSVGGNAYYQIKDTCTVGGTSYPDSADPGPAAYPISDAQIAQWKQDAAAGGVLTGDLHPAAESTVSVGPKEITGNLILDNKQTLNITGTLYVHGNVTLDNNALIRLDSSYGSSGGVIIADGWLHVDNNGGFQGAGSGSYLLVISTAVGGGHHNSAMDFHNNATGAIFFAPNGLANLHNNVRITALTAKQISLDNNASLVYDSGLADARFSSGPGGAWTLSKGTWREIK